MHELFQSRRQHFQNEEQKARETYNRLSMIRLAWFVAVAVAFYLFWNSDRQATSWLLLLVGIAGFLILLKCHQQVQLRRDRFRWLAFINHDEAGRIDRNFVRSQNGLEYSDPAHPYAADLDVFGNHSLFRLLNRTHTYEGSRKLAQWLLYPADEETILLRQAAVAEWKPQIDWRQDFEALAYGNAETGQSPAALKQWTLQSEKQTVPGYVRWLRFLLPILTLTLVAFWLAERLPGWVPLLSLGLHGLLLSRVAEEAKQVSEQTYEIAKSLQTYQSLLGHLGVLPVEAAYLRRIQARLKLGTRPADQAIGQLGRLVQNLNFRRNPYFFLFIGIISLWDVHYLTALDNWRRTHGPHLADWLDALAEAEALNSLAGLAFAHPAYAVPDIRPEGLELEATQTRHPLLSAKKSVANSLSLSGQGRTVLITGSNMSGKSTFLRTVGANVVLALAGSVVAAERFVCSPVQVFTSMRTQDSLEESTSSFYAELKRLKALIERTSRREALPVLYFLDEILKGTNSADRHRGARALILQLHETTASGFVSTHDVELGDMAVQHPFIENYSFHSDVVDGNLHFDYTLRPGVCRSFNASQLMQAIGIDVEKNA